MFATGPPASEALAPYAPTPLRLARPLARTTRTRNATETDFPIELLPLNLRPRDDDQPASKMRV